MQAAETLQAFCEDVGIPDNLNSDRASEFYGQESSYLKLAKDKRINLTYADPELPNEIYNFNIAIRELKRGWHHKMVSKDFPRRLLDFGLKHTPKVIHVIP